MDGKKGLFVSMPQESYPGKDGQKQYTAADMVNSGYSDCTVKITYQAKMNSDDSVVFGDAGNPNEVVLVWRRTSTNY